MWTFKQVLTFIRFASPHAFRLIFSALGRSIWMVVLSVIALFRGLGVTSDHLAERWLEEALNIGFPPLWEVQLRATFRILARLTIILGWALLLFTEWHVVNYTLRWIFG